MWGDAGGELCAMVFVRGFVGAPNKPATPVPLADEDCSRAGGDCRLRCCRKSGRGFVEEAGVRELGRGSLAGGVWVVWLVGSLAGMVDVVGDTGAETGVFRIDAPGVRLRC